MPYSPDITGRKLKTDQQRIRSMQKMQKMLEQAEEQACTLRSENQALMREVSSLKDSNSGLKQEVVCQKNRVERLKHIMGSGDEVDDDYFQMSLSNEMIVNQMLEMNNTIKELRATIEQLRWRNGILDTIFEADEPL